MNASTTDSAASARGASAQRGQRPRGNRAGQGRNRGSTASTSTAGGTRTANRSAFTGSTPEMNGNVFERFEEQLDHRQYAKTMEALEAYTRTAKLSFSADLASLFNTPSTSPVIDEPVETGEEISELKKMIFREEVNEWISRTRALRSNLATLYTVIWGQCSEEMKSKVKTHKGYKEKTVETGCHWLLQQIKSVTMQYDNSKHGRLSLQEALERYYSCKQAPGQTVEDYVYALTSWAETIESHGGQIDLQLKEVPENDSDGNPIPLETRKYTGREASLATAIIRGADKSKFGSLITSLANAYALGRDEYPSDALAAQAGFVHRPVHACPPPRWLCDGV